MSAPIGRPKVILDQQQIIDLIAKGYTVEYVANYFDVSIPTIYTNYSDELRKGRAIRDGCLQAKQYEVAMGGNVTMDIWLGKQWLGQRDKTEVTVSQEVQFDGLPTANPQLTSVNQSN